MPPKQTILIVGGGFGGVYTARHLEALLKESENAEVVLVSRHNYFLMTPLLFEAGSGVLEARHAVSPIRGLFHRARFIQADVQGVDLERKVVTAKPPGDAEAYELPYAHLVVAVGGITNTSIIPGADTALTFKVLSDALFLRNHAIELFERADAEKDPRVKRRLLTFVIAGGGLVGMELVGELSEFLKNLARSYPRVQPEEIKIELVEGGPLLMKEMDRDLADYARDVLTRRGVKFRTGTRVKRIEQRHGYHTVVLPDDTTIDAATVVVSTGVTSNPLLEKIALGKDPKGRLATEPTMLCKGRADVWSLGDCANIPDPTGKPYPQLAQHALREAKVLAGNIAGALRGEPPKPFVFQTLGTLAALGQYKGVGKLMRFKIRGFVAWWVWRTYYLLQMPGMSRRFRILMDWTVALFFRNDIVELNVLDGDRPTRST